METDQSSDGHHMCRSLYLAVYRGQLEEVIALLTQRQSVTVAAAISSVAAADQANGTQHGQCDILEVSAERNTAFHLAAEQGHHDLIRQVYLRFKENSLVSRRNSAQDTPLHCAARAGHAVAVTALLELAKDCGEDVVGCKNEAGDTALHLAARHGHGEAVEALATAAPELSSELNSAGVSPLYLAVMSRSATAVRAIVSTCSDASYAGPNSQNALHAAVFQSSEMVEMILEWKPTLAGEGDVNGSSPLHFASSDGDRSIVSAIMRAAPPSTVYLKDLDGLSALHVAARMGHHLVVMDLIKACPDTAELRDGRGRTFLHAAAEKGHASVVWAAMKNPILVAGVMNAQDKDGNTPLHHAVDAAVPSVVKALASGGVVRGDIMNNEGYTPFDLAANSSSFLSMISLVLTLTVNGSQSQPQRQDCLKQWSGRNKTTQWIRKTTNSLAVVAVLLATVAFSATFNVPGGYGDDGKAVLQGKKDYVFFIYFDSIAMTASVVAVILLVYGKASGSWVSFILALHSIWVSLITMILAFYAALIAVTKRGTTSSVIYEVIFLGIYALVIYIVHWIKPAAWITIVKFMWSSLSRSPERHGQHRRAARQYPFAVPYSRNLSLFVAINIIAYFGVPIAINRM